MALTKAASLLAAPHAEANGTADALTTASIVPTQAAPCNTTLMAALRSWPELSTLVAHLEAAGDWEALNGGGDSC